MAKSSRHRLPGRGRTLGIEEHSNRSRVRRKQLQVQNTGQRVRMGSIGRELAQASANMELHWIGYSRYTKFLKNSKRLGTSICGSTKEMSIFH